ncbi:hypothetical protein J2Y69_002132 [Microbacterium resistens]|uniref:Head-to-tail stopper n=1 Tax=Microbacterium resistens TaxID=156977 RepID=A0ABU1SE47_9MICO|nr:hypothetical protein [Microbacterium resistens]MDR6867528.1 hypothetical protein [Microbacterium resistens]
MTRLRKKHLPHRVTIQALEGEGAEGDIWGAPRADRPAYVEQKSRLVVDRRSTSPTVGQEVTSTTFVVLLLDDDCQPRSRVTVWGGTPRERTSEVLDSSYYEYRGTPSHVELALE